MKNRLIKLLLLTATISTSVSSTTNVADAQTEVATPSAIESTKNDEDIIIPTQRLIRTDSNTTSGVIKYLNNVVKDAIMNPVELKESTYYTTTSVHIRRNPDTDAEIVKTVPINTKLTIIENDIVDDWKGVLIDDEYFWISSKYLSKKKTEIKKEESSETNSNIASQPVAGAHLTRQSGVFTYNGRRESYYNLNMSGVVRRMKQRGFSGEYAIRNDGVKTFGGLVMVAADFNTFPLGTIVQTSLGTGIVCDTGSFVNTYGSRAFDIATNW